MRVIAQVRPEIGQVRERVVLQVGCELAEADAIGLVDVRKICQRIVLLGVAAAVEARATGINVLDVVLPGQPGTLNVKRDVVISIVAAETIVVGLD